MAEANALTGRAGRSVALLLGDLEPGEWAGPAGVRNRDEAIRALAVWRARLSELETQRPATRAERRSKDGRDWETARNVARELVDTFKQGLIAGRWEL